MVQFILVHNFGPDFSSQKLQPTWSLVGDSENPKHLEDHRLGNCVVEHKINLRFDPDTDLSILKLP